MHPTNDPKLTSFIDVAPESHFPIQNLPYGVCRPREGGEVFICTAIGEYVLNLAELEQAGVFDGPQLDGKRVFSERTLNKFMSMDRKAWLEARTTISNLLSADESSLRDNESLREEVLTPMDEVEMLLPVAIGDYTDFYSSEQHAFNVGTMFRGPENALKPNWKHLPVGYHGRASSVVVSGTDLHRPQGQVLGEDGETPEFSASKLLDFELEMGFVAGPGNRLGEPIPVSEAKEHIFGLMIVNDWSARDIQKWEYQPLGPFLAKNWATSVSPWVVPLEALQAFKTEPPKQNPAPLPYLNSQFRSAFDLQLEVYLKSEKLDHPHKICTSNYKHLYWSMEQQLAHHTVNGCNVRTGDLFGSGTISGVEKGSYGSMLELAWMGTDPVILPNGEQR